jgi:hypothetical protein
MVNGSRAFVTKGVVLSIMWFSREREMEVCKAAGYVPTIIATPIGALGRSSWQAPSSVRFKRVSDWILRLDTPGVSGLAHKGRCRQKGEFLTIVQFLWALPGVDLNGMKDRNVVPRIEEVVVQGQDLRENGEFVKNSAPGNRQWLLE